VAGKPDTINETAHLIIQNQQLTRGMDKPVSQSYIYMNNNAEEPQAS